MISDKEPSIGSAAADTSARIQVVDGLRGFALFGILLIHGKSWFDGGALPDLAEQINATSPIHTFTKTAINFLISGKFYTFFSFLFGLSFALMVTRTKLSDSSFLRRFMWRLTMLGLIGFAHNLHWRGDILLIYAMVGFVLILFRKASLPFILVCSLLLILNLPTRIKHIYSEYAVPALSKAERDLEQKEFMEQVEINYRTFKHGSYADVARVNFHDFSVKMYFQFYAGHIFITLGFFLLGLYAGRRQLFQRLDEHLPFFRKLMWAGGVATVVLYPLRVLMKAFLNPSTFAKYHHIHDLLVDSSNTALTIFYIASLTLLFYRHSRHFMVGHLASVGKMALTNYVLQSVFGTLVFYGYGLGLMGEIGAAYAVALCFPFFIFQLLVSHWWMAKFRYGPLEWLWRSLTLLEIQPFRKQKST